MITRRSFLKLLGVSGIVLAAPVVSLLKEKFPDGATADEVNEFLFFRGLRPCPHSHHSSDEDFAECTGVARRARGLYCINPDSVICKNCGENRRFFFNGDGFRIWRCGNCEREDIRTYLRRDYRPASSVQFTANMVRGKRILPRDPKSNYPWNREKYKWEGVTSYRH
jgi:hypothetical protein